MAPDTNVLGAGLEDVLSSALQSSSAPVYVVDPTPELVESLVEFSVSEASTPEIRVLADNGTLKAVFSDFVAASNAADLVAAGALELRVTDRRIENTLLVRRDAVTAVVSAGGRVAGLNTDDEAFVRAANDAYESLFEESDRFPLRTPAISAVRESLERDLGSDVRSDFDTVLDSLPADPSTGDRLDEVTICLLVAARHEVLLYDVSKWGEDIGIASKATFSRTKSELEDGGLIATEKVPIDVGRPRLRLKLDDERLADAPPERLATVALERLG
ncbi:transcriptional regulator TbsP [Halobellus sp. GM3]|uniref:transcriptional regulator TbsP n=1 Tax=Halobellus sp. GM3 TaxID=3458410 RepID=UPI00403E1763